MLDKNSPIPLYTQLEQAMRTMIFNKEWKADQMIPSEFDLSKTYGVSRMTARSVVTQLVNDGLLRRVQGKGTFVIAPKIPAKPLAYMGIREQLERLGYMITTKLLEFKQINADAQLASILDITQGDDLFFIKRVRFIEDNPISLHLSYIPKVLTPSLTNIGMENEQLCVILLREFNLKPNSVIETLESSMATTEEAELLAVPRRFPLLLLEDINKTSASRAFEYAKVLFRGDKIKLHFEYTPEPL